MKNLIKYYYNLDVSYIKEVGYNYYLICDSINYLFCPTDYEKIANILKYLNYSFHEIIPSFEGPVINYRNIDYALFKVNTLKSKITIETVKENYILVNEDIDIKAKWIKLWSDSVDFLEEEITKYRLKKFDIYKYFNYYVGLAETAISFLSTLNIPKINLYVAHHRVTTSMDTYDFYNPAFLTIDTKVRDIADYYKDLYFKSDIPNFLEKLYFEVDSFSSFEKCLFLARMLYPTYFFDTLFSLLNGKNINISFKDKIDSYEKVVKSLYKYIKKTTYIVDIDWFNQ